MRWKEKRKGNELSFRKCVCTVQWQTQLSPPCSILLFPGGSNGKVSVYSEGDPGLSPGLGRSPGEGNGNPLQYYCLENPMDRGAWKGTVHGAAKSWTRLSDVPVIPVSKNKNKKLQKNFLFACLFVCLLKKDWRDRLLLRFTLQSIPGWCLTLVTPILESLIFKTGKWCFICNGESCWFK